MNILADLNLPAIALFWWYSLETSATSTLRVLVSETCQLDIRLLSLFIGDFVLSLSLQKNYDDMTENS